MQEKFLLNQSLVDKTTESMEMAVIASILSSLRNPYDILEHTAININEIGYFLYGSIPDRFQRKRISNGLKQLEKHRYIKLEKPQSGFIRIELLDLNKYRHGMFYTLIYTEELLKIFRIQTKLDKYKLFNVFLTVIRNLSFSKDAGKLKGKYCQLSIGYMSEKLHISPSTFAKYIKELEKSELLYVYRFNVTKVDDSIHREINVYCRYKDKDLCKNYALVNNSVSPDQFTYDTNSRRRMKQIYNQICKGKIDYSESIYDELIMYINDSETAVGYDINIVYEAQQKALKNCN